MLAPLASTLLIAPLAAPDTQQTAYVKPTNTQADQVFGRALDMDGDTLVVGAALEDSGSTGVGGNPFDTSAEDAGSAYVFVRNGSTWTQQAYVKASNTQAFDTFGASVAIDGDTLVVGATKEDSAATGVNGDQANNAAQDSGAVYVFVRNGSTWSQQAYVKASNTDAGDWFGSAVAISGDTLVVSAIGERSAATGVDGNELDDTLSWAGAVYVFARTGSTWTQEAYLKPVNTDRNDYFGASIAIEGDRIVVGAPYESSSATGVGGDSTDDSLKRSGAVHVFERVGGTWTQTAYVKASNTGFDDRFGDAVALSGDALAVGASGEHSAATGVGGNEADDSAIAAGAVYVFRSSGGTWAQEAYIKASNTGAIDLFGAKLDLDGDALVVGASSEDSAATGVDGDGSSAAAPSSGAAYVFGRAGGAWSQEAYLKASNTGSPDLFGSAVAIAGGRVAVGAPFESSSATGIDGDQSNDDFGSSGAVYHFDLGWWSARAGCTIGQAGFAVPSGPARLGTTTTLTLAGGSITDGFAAHFMGAPIGSPSACGTVVPGLGEVLVAALPAPTSIGVTVWSASSTQVDLVAPPLPSLAGVEVVVQSAIVDPVTFAGEVSDALGAELRP